MPTPPLRHRLLFLLVLSLAQNVLLLALPGQSSPDVVGGLQGSPARRKRCCMACDTGVHVSPPVAPAGAAGHPSSVDALVAFDEDTLLSGCQDGMIRVIGVLPNAMLGVVGEHGDYPVESLALSGADPALNPGNN